MKKLMVLGAGLDQVPLIERAKAMGLYVIAVSPGDYPGMKLADKVIDCDIRDEKGVYEAAKAEGVDGIISDKTDMPLLAMAGATEKLGLPGNAYDCIKLFVDKYLMREKCKELGIRTIEYCRARNADDVREFMRKVGAPIIVKPVDSCASKGVTKVESDEEVDAAFAEASEYSMGQDAIVEQFIEGTELEVDSIVLGGKVKLLMYADLESFKLNNVFASTTRLYPSVLDDDVVNRLLELDKRIVEGFGLTQGLTHNEYIMDKDGTIHLIEVAARGGGTNISTNIARLQTGIDTPEFLINAALGTIDELPEYKMCQCHCGYVAFYIPHGKVISIEGKEDVEALPYVDKTTMESIHVGMEASSFTDKRLRHAIILSAESREQLLERIDIIRDMLKIKVETTEGIKGLIWK